MPDFNPDKERGQGKKKWVVQSATPKIEKSIKTGKGELQLDDKGRCLINDETLAREIQKDHRKDMAVSRIFMDDPADRGHHYFWGGWPEMPWKKKGDDDQEQSRENAEGLDELEPYSGEGVA
jgi:hypothetical protein